MSKGKVSKIGRHPGHDSVKIKRKRKASEEVNWQMDGSVNSPCIILC